MPRHILDAKMSSILLSHMDILLHIGKGARKRFTDKIVVYHGSNDY